MPWTDGLDDATIGHAQLQGWTADKNPEDIARAAVQDHLKLKGMLGAPPSDILRKPANAEDKAAWDALYAVMGKPADPKAYDLSPVKFKDGSPLDEGTVDFLRQTAHKLHLSPVAASQLAADLASWADNVAETGDTTNQATRLAQETELRQFWAGAYDRFKFDSDRAASILGLNPEVVVALEDQLGVRPFREMLRGFAEKLGEAKLIGGGTGGEVKSMTLEAAMARQAEYMKDTAWQKRYLAGDPDARAEKALVDKTIVMARFAPPV